MSTKKLSRFNSRVKGHDGRCHYGKCLPKTQSSSLTLVVINRISTCTCGYNQLQKYLRHCTVFWHKWPVHDLVLVIPPPLLIKVASNTRPYSKLGRKTLNGRERGQYYISKTCDQERFEARKVVFSWECLNISATGCCLLCGLPTLTNWHIVTVCYRYRV